MAKLLASKQEVRRALERCIRAGKDLTAKAERAEKTGGAVMHLESLIDQLELAISHCKMLLR
jgi:hypothetical protein